MNCKNRTGWFFTASHRTAPNSNKYAEAKAKGIRPALLVIASPIGARIHMPIGRCPITTKGLGLGRLLRASAAYYEVGGRAIARANCELFVTFASYGLGLLVSRC